MEFRPGSEASPSDLGSFGSGVSQVSAAPGAPRASGMGGVSGGAPAPSRIRLGANIGNRDEQTQNWEQIESLFGT